MRALLWQDVDLALARLVGLPPAAQRALITRWLAEAHAADKYRKRLHRAHPAWGDGTLAGRILRGGGIFAPPPRRLDAPHLAALSVLAAALLAWRGRQ